MGTGIIITMGSVAVGTMVVEKVLGVCGKQNEAQMVGIAGFSFLGVLTLGIVIKLLSTAKRLF